jgi:hypothetical protein
MISPEMEDFFITRTNYHINLVQKNLQFFIDNWYYPYGLRERATRHDKSKLEEPERTGYIYRTWLGHCVLNNIEFSCSEDLYKEAISHHLKNNSHHPEYHSCVNDMSNMDLIEMVCDWGAMAEEFSEDSAKVYADKVLGKKYKFHEENIKKIYSYIELLEDFKNKKTRPESSSGRVKV